MARQAEMRVALFVPCYVDQLFPDVAHASLDLLEAEGVSPEVALEPPCCGQPLVNLGRPSAARPVARAFERELREYDHVVCPSGSCVATLRRHADELGVPASGAGSRAIELTEFLTDVLGVTRIERAFPHRVGIHSSCHSLRELGQGRASELLGAGRESPMVRLLRGLDGVELVECERTDECCGFGGSFSVKEPEVSATMGRDRARAFRDAGAEIVTSADMSCLMHLGGILEREGWPLRVMHVAQILAGRSVERREASPA